MGDHKKLIIPETIRVGYQNREDTYTGKLAYVTYIDVKGVHRSEKSWNGWRDHKIKPKDFKNEPTTGFVLNKKVGGHSWGWNPRQTYARVYDPRGFEFEIDIVNLLFILDETSSIKGKGLEGEFVYSWDGKNIVLLPVTSVNYTESFKFTELQAQKVVKKDMREGCLYRNKSNQTVMYLGRHEVFQYKNWRGGATLTKMHVFRVLDNFEQEWDGRGHTDAVFWFQKGFTKLASRLSDEPESEFVNYCDELHQSRYRTKASTLELVSDRDHSSWDWYVYKHTDGTLHLVQSGYYAPEYGGQIEIDGVSYKIVNRQLPSWFVQAKSDYDNSRHWGRNHPKLPGKKYELIYVNEHGKYVNNHYLSVTPIKEGT